MTKHLFTLKLLVALFGILFVLGMALLGPTAKKHPHPMDGQKLPDIGITLPHRPFLLNIFASWCAPCQVEHPIFVAYSQSVEALPIIGINYKDTPDALKAYLAKNGQVYSQMVIDAKGQMGIDLGISGVPETLLVDADGTILRRWEGPFTDIGMLNTFIEQGL